MQRSGKTHGHSRRRWRGAMSQTSNGEKKKGKQVIRSVNMHQSTACSVFRALSSPRVLPCHTTTSRNSAEDDDVALEHLRGMPAPCLPVGNVWPVRRKLLAPDSFLPFAPAPRLGRCRRPRAGAARGAACSYTPRRNGYSNDRVCGVYCQWYSMPCLFIPNAATTI
jgi:hypothetical protein